MADDPLFGHDIFVYTGGRAPHDVKRVRICETIDTIPNYAFYECVRLIEVEGHDRLKKIEGNAFDHCCSLRRLKKMGGVIEVGDRAFNDCYVLSELVFDKLEIIGRIAFGHCRSLVSFSIPSVRRVGENAFWDCTALTDAVFGKDLERIEGGAFHSCTALRRIAIPWKDGFIVHDHAFHNCKKLIRVDSLVGGIHNTISSLHMERWKSDMKEEVERINQTLPDTQSPKGAAINQWNRSVLRRMEHYRAEHKVLVKEAMTLLELALWKVKLDKEGKYNLEEEGKKAKKARIDEESTRKEHRVTCGANIVIKNVLPFLVLK